MIDSLEMYDPLLTQGDNRSLNKRMEIYPKDDDDHHSMACRIL